MPEIGFGIGVSAGRAVAGNVGSEQRFEYTVIGDPVNEAARLSDLAKERDEHVIASDAALDRASEPSARPGSWASAPSCAAGSTPPAWPAPRLSSHPGPARGP